MLGGDGCVVALKPFQESSLDPDIASSFSSSSTTPAGSASSLAPPWSPELSPQSLCPGFCLLAGLGLLLLGHDSLVAQCRTKKMKTF